MQASSKPFLRSTAEHSFTTRRTYLLRLLFILLALASIPTPAQRATNEAISVVQGQVNDATGAAIAGAIVSLRQTTADRLAGTERAATTDATGSFRFENIREGRYRLSVTGVGFATATEEIALAADEERRVELVLQPGTISERVTVTATRSETLATDTAVPISVVERAELERRALATVGDLFRTLPGVSTTGEGPFQVRPRIRGLESNRVLILVDGERLNNTRTSTSNSGIEIGLVDVDQIESVEVARGSGSVLYGTDALAGTINIITRDTPPRRESGFRFGGGFDGFFTSNETGRRGSANLTGAGHRFSFRIAQTLDRYDNYHSGAVPTGTGDREASDRATEVPNSQYHGSNTQLVGRFFISDRQTIRGNYERRRAANVGVPAVAGVFTAFFPFSNRDKVSVRYEGQNLLPRLSRLSVSTYYQQQDRSFTNLLVVPPAPGFPGQRTFSETATDTATFGYDVQTNFTLGSRNVLTAGSSYFRDRNRDARFIERFSPNFRTNPPSLVRSEDRSRSVPDATFGDLAFFAQDEYQPTSWLRLIGGVRVDRFNIESERTADFVLPPFFTAAQIEDLGLTGLDAGLSVRATAVSGDFGIVVQPTEAIHLRARIGRSFREPNLFERFFTDFGSVGGFVVGNPNLEPESGVNIDTGISLRTRRFAGSFTYFNNTYTNFLASQIALDRNGAPITVRTTPAGSAVQVFQTVNFGRTRIQGVEGEFESPLQFTNFFITPFGNITYLRGGDLQRDEPLNFISPLKTVIGLRAQDARARLFSEFRTRIVNTQERLTQSFSSANGGAESGFVTHDLRGGYNFRHERVQFGVTVGVENLLNRYYSEQFVFAPARGRSLVVGTNLRFF